MWGYSPVTGKIYHPCQCCFEFVPKDDLMNWVMSGHVAGQLIVLVYQVCPRCWDGLYEQETKRLLSDESRHEIDAVTYEQYNRYEQEAVQFLRRGRPGC